VYLRRTGFGVFWPKVAPDETSRARRTRQLELVLNSARPECVFGSRGVGKEPPIVADVVKTLWASVQGNPAVMRRVNGWLTIVWIAMIPISLEMGWLNSVAYVSALSLWALVSGHWSAWQAARVECEQQREAEEAEADPLEDRVVRKLLAHTNITPATSNGAAITTNSH
jgi:hypothetical protein